MSDDKGDNITESVDEAATASATDPVSETQDASPQASPTVDAEEGNKLGGLMADGEAPAAESPAAETPAAETPAVETPAAESPAAAADTGEPAAGATSEASKPSVDLDAEAMRAAEQALAEGEKALAAAREQLKQEPAPAAETAKRAAGNRNRELALRLLLAVNVLAMVVVAMLPSPTEDPVETSVEPPPAAHQPKQAPPPVMKTDDPWSRALRASAQRDFGSAVAILERYLEDNPRMPESERLGIMGTLSIYAARNKDIKKAEKYRQQVNALEQSHYLPEDLVKMAEAALESGDQESLRRTWARFLLQQRQVPSWLYQHVAQAYLQLGDSYRKDADSAAEAARIAEMTKAAAQLREEALQENGK